MMKVGFIGIGAMGMPMAKNLLKAGFDLTVSDVSEEAVAQLVDAGAKAADTPKEVALASDVVITMLPNFQIVQSVMLGESGVLAGAEKGMTVIDMSSVSPTQTRQLVPRAEKLGVNYLDAPVSGGVAGAEKGTLTIMVGGPAEVIEKIMPVLKAMGKKIYHVGDVGAGDAMKIVNNLLLGINMAALSEALVLGVKAGLDPQMMRDIIGSSSGGSYALEAKMPNFILKGNFEPGFAIDLQYKDLELASQTGKDLGMPLFMGNLAQQIFEQARATGLGNRDISAVIQLWENLTNTQVRE
ncbi:MAG: NAD(P)-dependent oxidoreductase [Dehalobacterium sp.]|jgi:2-hydroxymethylglutarate dehydrogenase